MNEGLRAVGDSLLIKLAVHNCLPYSLAKIRRRKKNFLNFLKIFSFLFFLQLALIALWDTVLLLWPPGFKNHKIKQNLPTSSNGHVIIVTVPLWRFKDSKHRNTRRLIDGLKHNAEKGR